MYVLAGNDGASTHISLHHLGCGGAALTCTLARLQCCMVLAQSSVMTPKLLK